MGEKIILIIFLILILCIIVSRPGILVVFILSIVAIVFIVVFAINSSPKNNNAPDKDRGSILSDSNNKTAINELKIICEKLLAANEKLRQDVNELITENKKLKIEITENEKVIKKVVEENDTLRRNIDIAEAKLPLLKSYQYNNGYEYEVYCAFKLADLGFRNIEITQKSNDFGADIICESKGIKICVQCKCYSYGNVGVDAIQEVVAALAHYGCHKGIIMTTGTLTPSAIQLAYENNVEIIDNFL